MNYTSKMKLRNVPLLVKHYNKTGTVPENMSLGFAAYLLFMKCKPGLDGQYYGDSHGKKYVIQDEAASYFSGKWAMGNIDTFVNSVLSDKGLWDADLSTLNGFEVAVRENLQLLQTQGVLATLADKQIKTVA
jgi:tagaturonate reductase